MELACIVKESKSALLLVACHRFYFIEHVAPARRDATHAKFILYKRSGASNLIIAAFRETGFANMRRDEYRSQRNALVGGIL